MERSLQVKVDSYFSDFADSLTPSQDIIKRWNGRIHWLIQGLKQEFQGIYAVDRHLITGSVRKNTAVLDPDFDCVLFINNVEPPFQDIIEDFKTYLRRLPYVDFLYSTNYSLRFILDNEVYVDILPASNLTKRPIRPQHAQLNRDEIIAYQKWNTLEEMKRYEQNNPEMLTFYNSSLVESQLDFMAGQSPFVHDIVKLMKFWYKTVCCGNGYRSVPGLKYLIELVGVYWAQLEETEAGNANRPISISRVLSRVFRKLSNLQGLRIIFCNGDRISQNGVHKLIDGSATLPNGYKVSRAILNRGCFVMDPSNPFNDILDSVTKSDRNRGFGVLTAMETYANASGQYLSNNNSFDWANNERVLLAVIFKNRSFRDLELSKHYSFIVLLTGFDDWTDFITIKKMNGKKSRSNDIISIDTAFQTGAAIEGFRNQLLIHPPPCHVHVLTAMDRILIGIAEYIKVQSGMGHMNRVEKMFRNKANGRRWIHTHREIMDILAQELSDFPLLKILQAPIWQNPFYGCTMLIFQGR